MIELARREQDANLEREAGELLDALEGERVTVLVAGQFNRGKSTLINAVVGVHVLPTGVLPLTAVATIVQHGKRNLARVVYRDGHEQWVAIEDIGTFVSEAQNPQNTLDVSRVEVEVDKPLLDGVCIVDSPGVGSIHAHNTASAQASLRLADIAILVLGADPPLTEVEADFAAVLDESSERLFIVLNKIDQVAEAQEVVDFTNDALRRRLGREPQTFVLSAKLALQAAAKNEPYRPLDDFVSVLTQEIARDRQAILNTSLVRRTTRAIEERTLALRTERDGLRLPLAERAAALERYRRAADDLRERRDDASIGFERGLRDDLRVIENLLHEFTADEKPALLAFLLAAAERGDEAVLAEAIDEAFGAYRERLRVLVSDELTRHAQARFARFAARIEQLVAEVIAAGLESVGAEVAVAASAEPVEVNIPALRPPMDIATTGAELTVALAFRALPRAIRVRGLRARMPGRLEQLLDRERGRMRHAASNAVATGRRKLESTLATRFMRAEELFGAVLERVAGTSELENAGRLAVVEGRLGRFEQLLVQARATIS